MNKKRAVIIIIIVIIIAIMAGFFVVQKKQKVAVEQKQAAIQQQAEQETENLKKEEEIKNQKDLEIENIKKLVDGEYTFENVDISDWQTYRNEEMGFEIKIPKNWFCGRPGLLKDTSEMTACMDEKFRKIYYSGDVNINVLTISKNEKNDIISLSNQASKIDKKEKTSHNYITYIDGEAGLVWDSDKGFNDLFIIQDKFYWDIVNYIQKNKSDKDIFRGIVSSFKFLDPQQ